MARIVVAILKCDACGRTFEVRSNRAHVKCPFCGFVQTVMLDYEGPLDARLGVK